GSGLGLDRVGLERLVGVARAPVQLAFLQLGIALPERLEMDLRRLLGLDPLAEHLAAAARLDLLRLALPERQLAFVERELVVEQAGRAGLAGLEQMREPRHARAEHGLVLAHLLEHAEARIADPIRIPAAR